MAEGKKRLWTRKYANYALCNALNRTVALNAGKAEYPFVYRIKRLAVGGSLVKTSGKVHDVDLFVEREHEPNAFANIHTKEEEMYMLFHWQLDNFPHRFDSMMPWVQPWDEVIRWVKNQKGILSFHPYEELERLNDANPVLLIDDGALTEDGKRVLADGGADHYAQVYMLLRSREAR